MFPSLKSGSVSGRSSNKKVIKFKIPVKINVEK